jgi:protein ImuA
MVLIMGQEQIFPFTILATHRAAAVETLRQRIAALEGRQAILEKAGVAPEAGWGFGLEDVDARLPLGGLAADAVHEIAAAEYGDQAAALGFSLALLRKRQAVKPILWCCRKWQTQENGIPYGPGLMAAGLDPEKLIFVTADRPGDVLWAIEEGLCTGALGAVIGELKDLDFTASRRLALAARAGRTPALLLFGPKREGATAAQTRWRIAAAPSHPDPWDKSAPGLPRWRVTLAKCRDNQPASQLNGPLTPKNGTWTLEWDDETGKWNDATDNFGLAAALADRPAAPHPDYKGQEFQYHTAG